MWPTVADVNLKIMCSSFSLFLSHTLSLSLTFSVSVSCKTCRSCEYIHRWVYYADLPCSALILLKLSTKDDVDKLVLHFVTQYVSMTVHLWKKLGFHQPPQTWKALWHFIFVEQGIADNSLLPWNKTWLPNVAEISLTRKVAYQCVHSSMYAVPWVVPGHTHTHTKTYISLTLPLWPFSRARLTGDSDIGCHCSESCSSHVAVMPINPYRHR